MSTWSLCWRDYKTGGVVDKQDVVDAGLELVDDEVVAGVMDVEVELPVVLLLLVVGEVLEKEDVQQRNLPLQRKARSKWAPCWSC